MGTARAKSRAHTGFGRHIDVLRVDLGKLTDDFLDGFRKKFSHRRHRTGELPLDAMPICKLHLDNANGFFDDQNI